MEVLISSDTMMEVISNYDQKIKRVNLPREYNGRDFVKEAIVDYLGLTEMICKGQAEIEYGYLIQRNDLTEYCKVIIQFFILQAKEKPRSDSDAPNR